MKAEQFVGLICFLILNSAFFLFAQTNVSGTITENTTWSAAGSPYIVNSVNIRGCQLTIESGVEVQIESDDIDIFQSSPDAGMIDARGVVFRLTASRTGYAPINFDNNTSGNFVNCTFDQVVVRIEDTPNVILSDCRFRNLEKNENELPVRLQRDSGASLFNIVMEESVGYPGIGLSDYRNINTTISDMGLPYYVCDSPGSFNVKGSTLAIENGVEIIIIDDDIDLFKDSTPTHMIANGVTFQLPSDHSGYSSLNFNESTSGSFENCIFDQIVVRIVKTDDVSISNCRFRNLEKNENELPVRLQRDSDVSLSNIVMEESVGYPGIGLSDYRNINTTISDMGLPYYVCDSPGSFNVKGSTLAIENGVEIIIIDDDIDLFKDSTPTHIIADGVTFRLPNDKTGYTSINFDENTTGSFQNCLFNQVQVYIEDYNTYSISQCDFLNLDVALKYDGATAITAENNYWGHSTGPQHSNNVSGQGCGIEGNVDFDPWLEQPVSIQTKTAKVIPIAVFPVWDKRNGTGIVSGAKILGVLTLGADFASGSATMLSAMKDHLQDELISMGIEELFPDGNQDGVLNFVICVSYDENRGERIYNSDILFVPCYENSELINQLGRPVRLTYEEPSDLTFLSNDTPTIAYYHHSELILEDMSDNYYSVAEADNRMIWDPGKAWHNFKSWLTNSDDEYSFDLETMGVVSNYIIDKNKLYMVLKEFRIRRWGLLEAFPKVSVAFLPVDMTNITEYPELGSVVKLTGKAQGVNRIIRMKWADGYASESHTMDVVPESIEILNGAYMQSSPIETELFYIYGNQAGFFVGCKWPGVEAKPDFHVTDMYLENWAGVKLNHEHKITTEIYNYGDIQGTFDILYYYYEVNDEYFIGKHENLLLEKGEQLYDQMHWSTDNLIIDQDKSFKIIALVIPRSSDEHLVVNNILSMHFYLFDADWNTITAYCPVSLSVIDADNHNVRLGNVGIDGAKYMLDDFNNDGEIDHRIIIPASHAGGEFHVEVIPDSTALPDETYDLELFQNGQLTLLADSVKINEIPQEPYDVVFTNENVIFYENFESNDFSDNGWIATGNAQYSSESPYSGSYCLKGPSQYKIEKDMGSTINSDKITLEFAMRASQTGSNSVVSRFTGSNDSLITCVFFRHNGNIVAYDGHRYEDQINLLEYQADKWYLIRQEIDISQKTYDIFIDGVLVADNFNFISKNFGQPSTLTWQSGESWGTGWVDDIKLMDYTTTSINNTLNETTPKHMNLLNNYPNPFNPKTTIQYTVSRKSHIKITIYNSSGQEIIELIDTIKDIGNYSVSWNASDFSSGIYFIQFFTGDLMQVKKCLLIK